MNRYKLSYEVRMIGYVNANSKKEAIKQEGDITFAEDEMLSEIEAYKEGK